MSTTPLLSPTRSSSFDYTSPTMSSKTVTFVLNEKAEICVLLKREQLHHVTHQIEGFEESQENDSSIKHIVGSIMSALKQHPLLSVRVLKYLGEFIADAEKRYHYDVISVVVDKLVEVRDTALARRVAGRIANAFDRREVLANISVDSNASTPAVTPVKPEQPSASGTSPNGLQEVESDVATYEHAQSLEPLLSDTAARIVRRRLEEKFPIHAKSKSSETSMEEGTCCSCTML